MLVSVMFSGVIYHVLSQEIRRFERNQRVRIERGLQIQMRIPIASSELLEETKHRVLLMLLVVNSGIFFLAGGLGYFLAGRTLRPIQGALDEQNRFISDASHEIRTPLTALKSSMEVTLRDKRLTLPDTKKIISENIEEVDALQSLSDGLLQLAQYEKPNGSAHTEKLQLRTFVDQAVRKVAVMASQKKILIHSDIHPVTIEGRLGSLVDLFVILLDNAIKYSPIGSHIDIRSNASEPWVKIFVEDHGIGIDKKDVSHIFDRFYRANAARSKSDSGGYGLGLSIARKIVDSHRGSIHVKSELGKGSTFVVQLPRS